MTVQNLGRWIKKEHEQVQGLADRLTEKIAIIPRANLAAWIAEVSERFDHFRAHMTKHMALEEHEGYLPTVVERRPTLAPQIDRLHHEHEEFLQLMKGVHQSLESLTPEDHLLVRDCCHRIAHLLDYVEQHEELENNLVTFAFSQDIGTAG